MSQTVTALFDRRPEAEAAIETLVSAGIPRNTIRLLPGTETANRTSGSYDHRRDEGGFWSSLKDLFLPDEDRYAYSEGLSRGGTMLSVRADGAQATRITELLENAGAVHLDEREATWRKEGWSGYSAASAGAETTAARGAATGRDETIPVVEERLEVGKRVTEGGRVRVRSYVTETPVQESVSLHEESVHVERRPVDRAPTSADENLFAEKSIEATARGEQAVVSKEARVVEEIGLRKESTDRTETVSDTVRRTEVEVQDERGNVSRTGTTGAPTDRGR
ncbi:MAG TPA: YsnF/AvaK domain-containing protein [Methylobacterium sp.]